MRRAYSEQPPTVFFRVVVFILVFQSVICAGFIFSVPARLSFSTRASRTNPTLLLSKSSSSSSSSTDKLRQEAEDLLAQARALREELPETTKSADTTTTALDQTTTTTTSRSSPWNVPNTEEEEEGVGYRLYVDIGREEGTWMDPRWGASGKRIEFTLDIRLLTDSLAGKEAADQMVKDNFGGKSSAIYSLRSAPKARLRQGFDEMKCRDGAYRIDMGKNNGVGTIRFYVGVDGTTSQASSYGDVSVPEGALYFSLPAFGGKVSQLSNKEGPVTVRQMGWHTGWRREESRIVGVFRAVPIANAQRRDGF